MPQLINRVPPGLLSLLDIKSLGQNPIALADQLSPVLELASLYFESIAGRVTGSTPAVNTVGQSEFTGAGTRLRPNPGELWIIRRVAVRPLAALGAGTTYNFSFGLIDASLGTPTFVGTTISGTTGGVPAASAEGLIITASTAGCLWVHSGTFGVPATFEYNAQVAILRI